MRDYAPPDYLSYSQVSTFMECPRRWFLERLKPHRRTWWANIGGTAVHSSADSYDLREWGVDTPVVTFEEAFEAELAEHDAKGYEYVPSGRVTQKIGKTGGPNKKDKSWWMHWGERFVQKWRDWRLGTPWSIATMPDGSPGVEVPLKVTIGGKPAVGYIDRVVTDGRRLAIIDLKSGNKPDGPGQLQTYGIMLERQHGVTADQGFYFHAPSDPPALPPVQLAGGEYAEILDGEFGYVWEEIEEERFPPSPGRFCGSCFVAPWCPAGTGERQSEVTVPGDAISLGRLV